MKIEVKLYVSGKVFGEIVEAANYTDARQTALARNPKARVKVLMQYSYRWRIIKPYDTQPLY